MIADNVERLLIFNAKFMKLLSSLIKPALFNLMISLKMYVMHLFSSPQEYQFHKIPLVKYNVI